MRAVDLLQKQQIKDAVTRRPQRSTITCIGRRPADIRGSKRQQEPETCGAELRFQFRVRSVFAGSRSISPTNLTKLRPAAPSRAKPFSAVAAAALLPASSNPELGYIEFAGWSAAPPAAGKPAQMLLARETRIAGRSKRSFEVANLDTLDTDKQASEPALLAAFWKVAGCGVETADPEFALSRLHWSTR